MILISVLYFTALFFSLIMYLVNKAKSKEEGDEADESANIAALFFILILSPFILGLIGYIVFYNFIN